MDATGMKTIQIEQVANGWLVRGRYECDLNSYRPGDIHVYRSVSELRDDLIRLLSDDSGTNVGFGPGTVNVKEGFENTAFGKPSVAELFPNAAVGYIAGSGPPDLNPP